MNDITYPAIRYWRFLENTLIALAAQYGYHEIRTPIVESTGLFVRSIGEATDIVEKETYSFIDKNGDALTLRPEGTAGVVRAAIEQGLLYNQTQKLWYIDSVFRHERPQKGRYRQFHQFGIEAFGMPGYDIEAELLAFTAQLWKKLGIDSQVTLEINTLGLAAERLAYREALVNYFSQHQETLDEDSQRRLHKNPLRILDSKNPDMKEVIMNAPVIDDFLSETSKAHFEGLQRLLTQMGIAYRINPRLVRGLDYYCHTVFEWVTESLGAQGTVCAGGRYDNLVSELGGTATPAVGFAMGLERLILMLEAMQPLPGETLDIYVMSQGEKAREAAVVLSATLREALPSLTIVTHTGEGGFKAQFKKADKCIAKLALIIGEEELNSDSVSIKFLQEDKPQVSVEQDKLVEFLQLYFQFPSRGGVPEGWGG
jgi:histidyl-tRNA synthetase